MDIHPFNKVKYVLHVKNCATHSSGQDANINKTYPQSTLEGLESRDSDINKKLRYNTNVQRWKSVLHILIRTNLVKPNIKVKNKHRNMVGSYCESPYNDKWYQSRLFFFDCKGHDCNPDKPWKGRNPYSDVACKWRLERCQNPPSIFSLSFLILCLLSLVFSISSAYDLY